MFYHERCTTCGACVTHCPNNANMIVQNKLVVDRLKCNACGNCTDWCLQNAREIVGKKYTIKKLVKEAEKDLLFYEQSGGGITLSGGEVMAQDMDYIEELCSVLYNKGYSVNIDTCGYTPYENFERILPYVDTFLYDIKVMDRQLHKKVIGVDNQLILENLIKLSNAGAKINIRIPVVAGVNDSEEFINQVIDFLKINNIRTVRINLLPYHSTGKSKYNNLDRSYNDKDMSVPPKEKMEHFRSLFCSSGFDNTYIGG